MGVLFCELEQRGEADKDNRSRVYRFKVLAHAPKTACFDIRSLNKRRFDPYSYFEVLLFFQDKNGMNSVFCTPGFFYCYFVRLPLHRHRHLYVMRGYHSLHGMINTLPLRRNPQLFFQVSSCKRSSFSLLGLFVCLFYFCSVIVLTCQMHFIFFVLRFSPHDVLTGYHGHHQRRGAGVAVSRVGTSLCRRFTEVKET